MDNHFIAQQLLPLLVILVNKGLGFRRPGHLAITEKSAFVFKFLIRNNEISL